MNRVAAELHAQTRLRQKPNVLSSALDRDLVLMSLEADRYFGMDHIGRRIWELLAEPRSIDEACARLTVEFDVSPARCEADVLAFVGQLVEAQLVEIVAPAGPE